MTDRDPDRASRFNGDDTGHESNPVEQPADDRGGFRDTAPNPHDEAGAEQTAARAAGTITGMFFPVVIIAVVAIVVILFFVL